MGRIGFGIIGAGNWGAIHARVYAADPRAYLAGVCDVNEGRARRLASAHEAPVYTDYHEMLRDPNVNAVAVVTPDFAHRDPIVAAARAGKHIIVEKPLATTEEDLAQIKEEVAKAGILCMVDFHCRWCPPLVAIRNSIESGDLGEPVSAYLRLNNTINVPLKMLPWAAKSSILWFLGSHAVDTIRYLLDDEVGRVFAVSRSGVLKAKGVDVPDIYQSILEFRHGAIVTMENHWIAPNTNPTLNDFKVNVLGTKGMINVDLTHNQLIERYLDTTADHPDVLDWVVTRGRDVGFVYESIRYFIECVCDNTEPFATLDDGVKVSQVILAIMKSASTRMPVEL
jgi:predicted dehydrogenase